MKWGGDNPASGLSLDVLNVRFNYCSSVTKFRLAIACKSIFEFFHKDLDGIRDARSVLLFELQTRARIMAADYGCYNNYEGQTIKQVWKAVMRKMEINPKFCITEHECLARITNVLNKRDADELEGMLKVFRTFNMVFHDVLVESVHITKSTVYARSFSALLASHVPSGTQRTDRVMAFVDLCINSTPVVLEQILGSAKLCNLIKHSIDLTHNPSILLQYMRLPNEDLRYWCDVALKDVANS
jgi:hypothetical protein